MFAEFAEKPLMFYSNFVNMLSLESQLEKHRKNTQKISTRRWCARLTRKQKINAPAAHNKMGKVPPEKLEPDAQGASGHNDGYVKDNDTIHVQKTHCSALSS